MGSYIPGPWRWESDGDWHQVHDAHGATLTTGAGISAADARLIAAAPELLEFARLCVELKCETDERVRERLQALIQRIEGEPRE